MDHEFFTKPIESYAKQLDRAPFLISAESKTLYYSDIQKCAHQLGRALGELGLGKSSPLLVHLPRSPEQVLIISSLFYLGYPTLLLPAESKWHDFEKVFVRYPFSAVISPFSFANKVESTESLGRFQRREIEGLQTKISILRRQAEPDVSVPEGSWFLITSGSTGTPKVVVLDQKNLIERTSGEVELFQIEESAGLLNILPFHHDLGFNQLLTTLATGSSLELINNWLPVDLARKFTTLKRLAVTGMPSVWESLLKLLTPNASSLQTEGYITVSGGSLNPEKLLQLRKIFPRVRILKTYGQTETFRTFAQVDQSCILEDNCGGPIRGVDVLLLNESQQPCKLGEVGQLAHFGSGTMQGYWLSASETKSKTTSWQKWHPDQQDRLGILTGDYFKKIDSNRFRFMGRKDDLIKVNGHRFHTGEVERCLQAHQSIETACVLCVEAEEMRLLDKRLLAFVVLKSGQNVQAEEILNHCSKYLASFKIPQKIFFRRKLPMTSNFKIDRTALLKSVDENQE
ncbi:MAG: class I adenylate-forming enzyme family protein [Bdellovibrionales bacterium]